MSANNNQMQAAAGNMAGTINQVQNAGNNNQARQPQNVNHGRPLHSFRQGAWPVAVKGTKSVAEAKAEEQVGYDWKDDIARRRKTQFAASDEEKAAYRKYYKAANQHKIRGKNRENKRLNQQPPAAANVVQQAPLPPPPPPPPQQAFQPAPMAADFDNGQQYYMDPAMLYQQPAPFPYMVQDADYSGDAWADDNFNNHQWRGQPDMPVNQPLVSVAADDDADMQDLAGDLEFTPMTDKEEREFLQSIGVTNLENFDFSEWVHDHMFD